MKKPKLPQIDSIQELARFWDTHDLTDFEEQLEEITEPIFVRSTPLQVHLEAGEAKVVQQIAESKGVSQEELIRAWILQRLARWKGDGSTNRRR